MLTALRFVCVEGWGVTLPTRSGDVWRGVAVVCEKDSAIPAQILRNAFQWSFGAMISRRDLRGDV